MKTIQRKNIDIKGIERNANDINVIDGTSDEIINLRFKDGAWRPVGEKTITSLHLPNLSNTSTIYHHPVNSENIIYSVQIAVNLNIIFVAQNGASYTETTLLQLNANNEE